MTTIEDLRSLLWLTITGDLKLVRKALWALLRRELSESRKSSSVTMDLSKPGSCNVGLLERPGN